MRATAVRSCSPQSQRKLPSKSPVRHAECSRTGTALAAIGLADDDGHVLREAVLVAKHGDLAVERVRERHARAAQQLQRMVTEARRVMHDVVERDRHHAGRIVAVGVETDERRHEPAGLRELECGGGERRAARRLVDVERRAVDGCDADHAGERAQAVEIGRRGKRHGDGAAQLARQARRMRALGRHEHDGAAAARRRRAARTAMPAPFRWPRRASPRAPSVTCMARPRRNSSTARSNVRAQRDYR